MIRPLYAIFDVVANEYGAPFVAQSDAVAYRDFASQIENARKLSNGLLATNSGDFQLVRIGFYDSVFARFLPVSDSDFPFDGSEWHELVAFGGDFVDE